MTLAVGLQSDNGQHDGVDPNLEPARPVLRIVRGDPAPEELAALVAVVSAVAAGTGDDEQPAPPVSGWRGLPAYGAGAWRLSGFPKGVRTRASW